MELRGIDLSSYQGFPDWKKVKASGIQFVILRAHQRYGIDESFEHNYSGAQGLPIGVYKFSYALTTDEAIKEAEDTLAVLNGRILQFPVFYDLEWERQRLLSKSKIEKLTLAFLGEIKKAGYKTGIYCNKDWYDNVLTDTLKKLPCWVAAYPYNDTGEVVERLRPGVGIGWQYSSNGKVPGINGGVDMDLFFDDFGAGLTPDPERTQDPIDKVIAIAESQLGYTEKNSPAYIYMSGHDGDGNYTKYGKEMHDIQPGNMDYPAAWCDCFINWCMKEAFGIEMAKKVLCGDFDDYTWNSVNLYKKAGRWTTTPARGHQIFFGGSGHTGLVVKVEGNTVYTIEGNKNNAVRACSYAVTNANIVGYGMPRYDLVKDSKPYYPTVRKGDKGEVIRELQTRLNYLGYNLDVDGDFGGKTKTAVMDFQRDWGLKPDGIVGEDTWKALLRTERRIKKTPGIMREKPDKKSKAILKLKEGDVVYVLETENGWCKTTGGGWIAESNLE